MISFIVMASTNEYARKILNSPTHAEPCLVHSAKQVLIPENWCVYIKLHNRGYPSEDNNYRVFLTGKEHVEYRRGLNSLFTRKALGYEVIDIIVSCSF